MNMKVKMLVNVFIWIASIVIYSIFFCDHGENEYAELAYGSFMFAVLPALIFIYFCTMGLLMVLFKKYKKKLATEYFSVPIFWVTCAFILWWLSN